MSRPNSPYTPTGDRPVRGKPSSASRVCRETGEGPPSTPAPGCGDPSTPPGVPPPGGYREVLRVAVPLILATASLTMMLFADRMFLSWYGQRSVAASTPGGVTWFTICSFFMGTAQYVNTIVAQHHGAGDKPACARAVWQGVIFSVISAPLMLGSIPMGYWALEWAGHGPELLELEKSYFTILMFGGVALPLNASLSSFFSGRGKTRIVMWGNFLGNGANIVLNYLLIFGKLGFPEMGIRGAGYASAITGFIPGIYWACLFLAPRYQASYRSRSELRWDARIFGMLLRYGLPSGAQIFLDIASFTIFALLIGRYGEVELATSNIVMSIEMLSFLPMEGAAIATATLVGRYIGRGQLEYAEKSVYSACALVLAFSLFFAVTFFAIPETYLSLFQAKSSGNDPTSVLALGTVLLRIVAVYTLFNNLFIVFSGALTGAGDTRFAMWMQVALSWLVFVPAIVVVIEYTKLGVVAAWYCLLMYVVLLGVVFYLRFHAGRWKNIKMIENAVGFG